MASIIARGQRLYAKIQDINGRWRRVRTPFTVGQEPEAETWAAKQETTIAEMRALKIEGTEGALTVTNYGRAWLKKRRTKTVNDDRARLEKHVFPRAIGSVLVEAVRPRHLRDVIEDLKAEGKLAPKTIREVSGLLHTLFNSAVIDEVITENPVKYEKGVLPKKLDKDPSWRRQAIYARAEVEQLLSDARVPFDRRVLYALKFFTGRHSEVARLKWSQWDETTQPLAALAVDETKTQVPRLIPVHPALARVLCTWRDAWPSFYGRAPELEDFIVPTRKMTKRDANEAQRQLVYDLEKLGLRTKAGKERNRRGHDLRRTLITLARQDGAIDSMLRWVTHGPKPSEILDTYSTPPWEALCAEIVKLRISLPVSELGPTLVQAHRIEASPTCDALYERPRRDSNPRQPTHGNASAQSERALAHDHVVPSSANAAALDHGVVQGVTSTCCDAGLALLRAATVARDDD
jgi:integrase